MHFRDHFSALNVLNYISFRAGGAILTGLALSWLLYPRFIAYVRARKLTQVVREDGPATHLSKSGTPTMGGLLILAFTVVSTLLWARLDNRFVWLALIVSVVLGGLGFVDDFKKWTASGNLGKGVTPGAKLAVQMTLAILVVSYLYFEPPNPQFVTAVNVPYTKNLYLNIGVGYIVLAILMIVGSSNAVNLTDGLDGLAIGSLIISALTFSVFAYLAGHARFSSYLRIIPVMGAGELSVFLAGIVGAGLGFLWYNCHPAEVFMGDTGSLFLGGSLGLTAVIIKQELILVIVGGLFVAEVLSVLIQVYSFRYRGKRVFRMAPLHHHFELSGWQEPKVTVRFWIVAIVLSLIALASLKIR